MKSSVMTRALWFEMHDILGRTKEKNDYLIPRSARFIISGINQPLIFLSILRSYFICRYCARYSVKKPLRQGGVKIVCPIGWGDQTEKIHFSLCNDTFFLFTLGCILKLKKFSLKKAGVESAVEEKYTC